MDYSAEILAHWVEKLRFEDIPREVLTQAKLCILDWFAITTYGSNSPWARAAANLAREEGGKEEASILPQGEKFPCANAALVNGVSALSYDLSDTLLETALHPNCSLVGTALALAEKGGASGKEVLTAVVAGYEVTARIGEALNKNPQRFLSVKGFESNAVVPPLGAAATAAKLLDLEAARTADAFGIAGCAAGGGLIEYLLDGNWTYRWNVGKAAHDGIISAFVAREGFQGPHAVFEGHWDEKGRYGLLNAFAGSLTYAPKLSEGLGKTWKILDVGFKYFGCCHYIHGHADGILRLMKENQIGAEEIEAVTAVVPHMTLFLGVPRALKLRPPNLTVAQWSLPFCLATVILDGHLLDPAFQLGEERLQNPEVLALAQKIQLERDPSLDRVLEEEGILWSPLRLRTKDGKEYEIKVSCKGFRDNPLTAEEFNEKFAALTKKALTPEKAKSLKEKLGKLEELPAVTPLIKEATV